MRIHRVSLRACDLPTGTVVPCALGKSSAQVVFGDESSSSVQEQLHLVDLGVHFLHELNDEVYQLVLQHLLSIRIRDKEADIESFDGFPPKDDEALGSAHQEPHELLDQDRFDLVGLFYAKTHSHRIYGWFNQTLFVFVPADYERVEKGFVRETSFDLRVVVTFDHLRREVLQTECGSQSTAHRTEVILQRVGHRKRTLCTVPTPMIL